MFIIIFKKKHYTLLLIHSLQLIDNNYMRKLQQKEALAIAVAIPLLVFFFVIIQAFGPSNNALTNVSGSAAVGSEGTGSGLLIEDSVVGEGKEATPGKVVTVHYIGTLPDGIVFDSSRDRGDPFLFLLGAGQVIPGWEKGIVGMKVGGIRILVIPSELAYGPQGIGIIPPNATLLFEVELLAVDDLESFQE